MRRKPLWDDDREGSIVAVNSWQDENRGAEVGVRERQHIHPSCAQRVSLGGIRGINDKKSSCASTSGASLASRLCDCPDRSGACCTAPEISRARPIRRQPLGCRRKPPTGTSQNWWVGGCRPEDLLRERVSWRTCNMTLSYHHTLRSSVSVVLAKKRHAVTLSLSQKGKLPLAEFDCVYRIHVCFALARVAVLHG